MKLIDYIWEKEEENLKRIFDLENEKTANYLKDCFNITTLEGCKELVKRIDVTPFAEGLPDSSRNIEISFSSNRLEIKDVLVHVYLKVWSLKIEFKFPKEIFKYPVPFDGFKAEVIDRSEPKFQKMFLLEKINLTAGLTSLVPPGVIPIAVFETLAEAESKRDELLERLPSAFPDLIRDGYLPIREAWRITEILLSLNS